MVKKEPGVGRMAPINRSSAAGESKKNIVKGKINGKDVSILIDTGADFGLVPRAVVPKNVVDCGDTIVPGIHGERILHKSTRVTFDVAGVKLEREVAIDENNNSIANCILPLDLNNDEEVVVLRAAVKEGNVSVLTRSMAQEEPRLDSLSDMGVP